MPRATSSSSASAAASAYSIGDKVNCSWVDGSLHEADIVEERTRASKSGPKSSDEESGHKEVEYYVHYVDCE